MWNKQNGKCAYTNIQLEFPHRRIIRNPSTASLDRIDSNEGYVQNNIEFVSLFMNLGKNEFTKQQVLDFLGSVPTSGL